MGGISRAFISQARKLVLTGLLPAHFWAGADPAAANREDRLAPAPEPQDRQGDRLGGRVWSQAFSYPSSDDRGADRTYSGRLYFPSPRLNPGGRPMPLVVYAHATEPELARVPQFDRGDEAMVGALAAYLHQFAVAMPDLPGYGQDPSPRPHPYCHARSLAPAVLDLVRPVLALMAERRLAWDGRLFLIGYSSGAYAALAALKAWQHEARYADLAVTAAACMAGPFHLSESIRCSLQPGASCARPDIQAMLMRAYHDLYPESGVFALERSLQPALLEHRDGGPDAGDLRQWLAGAMGSEEICRRIRFRLTGSPLAPAGPLAVLNPAWVQAQFLAPEWPDTEVGRILGENDLVGGWIRARCAANWSTAGAVCWRAKARFSTVRSS